MSRFFKDKGNKSIYIHFIFTTNFIILNVSKNQKIFNEVNYLWNGNSWSKLH
jgi:hypothetical protein